MSTRTHSTAPYLGPFLECHAGYTTDDGILERSASGGFVTSFLIWLLREGHIERALLTRCTNIDGQIGAASFIASNVDEILSAQNSVYIDGNVSFFDTLHNELDRPGRLAIVCLPCQANAIRKMTQIDPTVSNKIVLLIGLACIHTAEPELINDFLESKGIDTRRVTELTMRGKPRDFDNLKIHFDREVLSVRGFALYFLTYFHSSSRCLSCSDQLAEHSDISCCDVWRTPYMAKAKPHSFVIVRTAKAQAWFNQFCSYGLFYAEKAEPEAVVKSQQGGLHIKKRAQAIFARFGPFFGYHVMNHGGRTRWPLYYLGALCILISMRVSQHKKLMSVLYRIPRPFMSLYRKTLLFLFHF